MSSQPHAHPTEAEQSRIVVDLFREPGSAQFSCSMPDWNFMRELGTTFGWRPVGTTYLPQQGQRARHQPIKHDYGPGDSEDSKRVDANDAAHWAAALDTASRSPFISGMLRKRAQSRDPTSPGSEQSLQVLLEQFIQFARRGAFTIALRRDP